MRSSSLFPSRIVCVSLFAIALIAVLLNSAVKSVGQGPTINSATATPAATSLAQFSQQGPKLVGAGAVGNDHQG
jgi:hypothetical protein